MEETELVIKTFTASQDLTGPDVVSATVAIDFKNRTVSLVNYNYQTKEITPKKYLFTNRGPDHEWLWLAVLQAQEMAIKQGMKILRSKKQDNW